MMQEAIVAVIVICAAFAVINRYAPKAVKRIARSWSARTAIRFGRHALAAKIERQAQAGASCGDGCGACGNCGSKSKMTVIEKPLVVSLQVDAVKGRPSS